MSSLKRRVRRLYRQQRRADWPRRPLARWSDEELEAALRDLEGEAHRPASTLTDDELLAELQRYGLL